MWHMSLPIDNLRKRLQELIKNNERGYMANLSELSGIPDGTIHRVAFGKQKTVTYKIWKKLFKVEPELPPPTSINSSTEAVDVDKNKELKPFIAAIQHYYPIDEKFKTPEDLALSVGLRETEVKSLLLGDFAYIPTKQQKEVMAHAFGMSLNEFISAGNRITDKNKNTKKDIEISFNFDFEKATTKHPEIVQIVKMAEQLDDEKVRILKELTLKLLITHMKDR